MTKHFPWRQRCSWLWHWGERCDSRAIPGGHLCAEHLIEKAGRKR